MEQSGPARRSSGIYDHDFAASAQSLGSQAGLASHARPPAGSRFSENNIARTTGAGVPVGISADDAAQSPEQAGEAAQDHPQPSAAPTVPFYKKRWFIISQAILIPLGIALLFILLFPVVTAIVQLVVNRSQLGVDTATISSPSNTSFNLGLKGTVTHTGIISAKITFTNPIQVSWVQDNGSELTLGTMTLQTLAASHKRATIDQNTTFDITNEQNFGVFAAHMITASNFTWRLHSDNLHVQAVKFPVSKGIKFDKQIVLNGFNSFNGNVVLKDLQLPSDNPAGGIDFVATTGLTNPSPFSLNLGTVVFGLSYQGVFLGSGSGNNTVIKGNQDNDITLSGFLIEQSGESNLAAVSQLFTNYLNGDDSNVLATGESTLQSDGTAISWLSTGLQSLQLQVPFKSLSGPISPIKTITIGDLGLRFFESTPWGPSAESRTVHATMELPFGFSVDIGEIQNEFNITKDGQIVAGLSTPLGASESSISVLNSTLTTGSINIMIENTNLSVPDPDHPVFSSFNANLTSLDDADFQLIGHSRAVANLSIGQITLDPIKFNVSSGLKGLQGLKRLTTINSVDVQGGTAEGITLGIDVSIVNPSNLNLSTGDLNLQLFRDGALLGTTLLPNLTLVMGNNSAKAKGVFQPNNSPQGLQTLDQFVGKTDVQLSISGFNGSTEIVSLTKAFETLNIDVTLPALQTNLLNTAALTVLPTTGITNNISHVTVDLSNPFTAGLDITRIQSTISAFGISLGTIDSPVNFTTTGKSNTTSPELPLNLNFDPNALFTVTRVLAVEAGLDPAPLDGIVQLGGYTYLKITGPTPSTQRRDNLFTNFNLPTFVQTAFKKLQSDVNLTADVTIGEYATVLQYTQSGLPTGTDSSLDLILPILARPIVQSIVSGSALGIDTVLITDPQLETFNTRLNGSITNAGPFDANIAFPTGLTVSWAGKALGTIKMDNVSVVGDVGAEIRVNSAFQVADVDTLTDFTKTLLTDESFDWEIAGENLTVSALGIDVSGISLTSKKVTLKGFNGLKGGVQIQTFDLPSNDPAGGIHLTLEATTTNPSQVGIELSSIGFNTFAENVMIAPVQSNETVTLSPGATSTLSLVGRLVPQNSSEGLAVVSQIFNNFVHGQDSDLTVNGASAGPSDVTWLNEGIKALQIQTVLPNRGVQQIIKSIELNQLTLMFTEDTAYDPLTSSNSTDAAFTIPFAFPIDITSLEQVINVGSNGQYFAQLAIPRGPSTTDVDNRVIHLTFNDIPFAVTNGAQEMFNNFLAATTTGKSEPMDLSGAANADANTAVGTLSLTDIEFSVGTSIAGLQGLNTKPVTVSDLDVNHGFPDYLLIKVNSDLLNPSNLTIGTGDVSFSLQFQGQQIGMADLSNLVIQPGDVTYAIDVHYAPQGGAVAAGQTLLENFLQGVDSNTTIAGSTDSTPIESLKTALSEINLAPVTIPAMHQSLITSASLTFPSDIVSTGIAQASFTLANPFTASINLLKVGATATYRNITLGSIDNVDVSSNPIHANGHSNITSPTLPMKFNLDPVSIVQFISMAAQANDVNLGPLTDMFQFIIENPEFHPPVNTSVDSSPTTCVSGNQFDVDGAILDSLKNLQVDLQVQSSTKLDDFATDLSFAQHSVKANTDDTALFLIGAVAGPIAQHLVDGAELAFSEANITNISNEGFDLSLRGSLTNTGPLDALITFVEPVEVAWQGQSIATITLPPVCAAANSGVPNYETTAHLSISDLSQFTSFATFLLHNPSFDWTISTPKLRLTALGTIFDNVSLSKNITLKAFNGLPGVTISNFQLPSDDPQGGIHIETDAQIPSPAQLGIDLGTVTFQSLFGQTVVGPLSASGLVLTPNSETTTHLSGRIVPQSGSDLDNIGTLFSKFLAGDNQTLIAKGDTVQPSGSSETVTWLSDAFKTLSLSVTLPGQKFTIIQSIALSDLDVTLENENEAFAPPTSSNFTLAEYKNPFGFSLQVIQSAQDITLSSDGTDIAQLTLPKSDTVGGVSTGNVADLQISWDNQALKSLNNGAFEALFAAVTLQSSVNLNLRGSADVTAKTTIGDVPISGIPFNVPSSLKGLNDFGGTASLSNVTVTGSGGDGGNQFIVSPLTTALDNPSNVSLHTVGIALPVMFDGVKIGRAAIDNFDLLPGSNSVASEFHYQPDDANDTVAQGFLTDFLTTTNSLALNIQGDTASTPIESLQEALAGVKLSTELSGKGFSFIQHVTVTITLDSLVTNLVDVDFDLMNPLDATMSIKFVQSDAGVNNETFAHFDQPFDNFVIPPGQTVNSGTIPNVLLTQGALASLGIIPLGVLDVFTASTVQIDVGGYEIPWLKLNQFSVPTTYNLALSLDIMRANAKVVNASSVASSSSAKASASSSASDSKITSASTTEAPVSTGTNQAQSQTTASEHTTIAANSPSVNEEPSTLVAGSASTTASAVHAQATTLASFASEPTTIAANSPSVNEEHSTSAGSANASPIHAEATSIESQ